jgi:class 3 adenylate cyclase/tetratricopeptide (TPR) repeat protein
MNADAARFCGDCGTSLVGACPQCGAPSSGRRFCEQCGAQLSVAPSGRAEERPVPEPSAEVAAVRGRRLVSVLFADLVGFTSLSETRDAEDVRDLLVRFSDVAQNVVERYGGVVDNFIGDAVFAVWGTPVVHEDDAERAVRCALELIDAIALMGVDIGLPGLAARAGVLTGEVAVNEGGPSQRLVAGDLVNTASRFQTAAEPRTVYVGESTYLATSRIVAYRPVGELVLKGKEEPVRAWQAIRVIDDRQSLDRGIEAPFIGRGPELRTLKEALDSVREEHRIRLVSVTGIPGIGKSRLAAEFFNYVEGIANNHYWHEGRSPAYGEGISFWALAEMVRMRARIIDDEDAASSRAKLRSTLDVFVEDESERDWIGERLFHLLGLSEAPTGSRDETFSAWRRFFELIAERDPVVMVFEDLQWADSGLIDFIESLLEWSRSYPILIVTLARPELFERRPNWGAGQRNFTAVHLEPLDDEAMRSLLFGLVVDLPEAVADRILERAEGVPLYAVEIVRMLAAKGFLVEEDNVYRASGDLGDIELPDSLHALVASRLDVLPPDIRGMLQDASVIGKSFSVAALGALTGRSDEEIEGSLRDLVRREFLTFDSDPRSPERGQYGFLQAVIREIAYSMLSRRDRREKHLAAAKHFGSVGEELAGVVASHYLEAYRASPDGSDRDDLANQARSFLAEAGRRALSLGAPELARSYFEQSLEVTPDGHEHAELTVLAARAALACFKTHEAIELSDRAIAELGRFGDDEDVAEVVARFSFPKADALGEFVEAIARAEQAYDALGEESSAVTRGRLAAVIAGLRAGTGEVEKPLEWSDRALSLIQQTDDNEGLISALMARAFALFRTGRRREAVILARGAAEVAEFAGLSEEFVDALGIYATFSIDDEPRSALAAHKRAAEIARKSGNRPQQMGNLANLAEEAVLLGEWETARSALERLDALEIPEGSWSALYLASTHALFVALTKDVNEGLRASDLIADQVAKSELLPLRATHLWERALMHLTSGDAASALMEAVASVETDPTGINAAQALRIEARAALWLHDLERARSAVSAMESMRGRVMSAARDTATAGIAALEGRTPDSLAQYEAAARAWKEVESPLDLAWCWVDMSKLLGSHSEGRRAHDQARELLLGLGSQPMLSLVGG